MTVSFSSDIEISFSAMPPERLSISLGGGEASDPAVISGSLQHISTEKSERSACYRFEMDREDAEVIRLMGAERFQELIKESLYDQHPDLAPKEKPAYREGGQVMIDSIGYQHLKAGARGIIKELAWIDPEDGPVYRVQFGPGSLVAHQYLVPEYALNPRD